MAEKAPFVPVVAVLNMKGGVGKTTLCSSVFRILFERKKLGTLLIDLDPQFNLTQALFTRPQYNTLKKQGKTISVAMEPPSDVGLFTVKTTSEPPPDVDEISETFFYFPKTSPVQNLSLVPGDFDLVKYSLMDDNKKLSSVAKRFANFLTQAKKKYRLICIDCNPSSSFLTLCALKACTHIVVPVRPDRYSILGLDILAEFVSEVPSISPKPQFIIVLNGIPRRSKDRHIQAIESELRGHEVFGSKTLVNVIHDSSHLRAKTDYTGFATDRKGSWTVVLRQEIAAVADELATKLGIQP